MNKWLQDFAYQNKYKLVDICYCRFVAILIALSNSKLPGNKSSDCKSGEEFENGIKILNDKLAE